ncbi:MAG: DUF3849 domain-containing protein [Firmicutes bacterium]|nr:DUF3849 domain-containing protein [Bacillota bacterium]
MFEATAGRADPEKLVYPYSFEEADKRSETPYYHDSSQRNGECARAIDAAINSSRCKENHYNLNIAAMTVIHQYGCSTMSLRGTSSSGACGRTHETTI